MSGQTASKLAARDHQMFPVLSAAQVAIASGFAISAPRRFLPGETIFSTGERDVAVWLVLEGGINIYRREGIGGEAPITSHGAGEFTGEVGQLDGRASLAAARAGPSGCLALPFDRIHLRVLMVGSADIGEIIMRAMILRQVGLIEEGSSGTILIGAPDNPHLVRLQGFLTRTGYPNLIMDPGVDVEGKSFVEQMALAPGDLPLVVCPDGAILKRPGERELAACLGILPDIASESYYVAIVGAGPAGLAAAVYGASEGLSVLVLDERAMGGQAGASARIENYLGFPTGISGQALAGRALNQALKFGAEIAIPTRVTGLGHDGQCYCLQLSGDQRVRAQTVVIACGAEYREPALHNIARLEGAGISYWASPVEARLCAGKDIALVGGGNSAGQAIVFLAPQVRRLHLFVRRELEETMSRYLIERISALPNVEIHVGATMVGLEEEECRLSAAIVRIGEAGSRFALSHMFLFIGATPHTAWLKECVVVDEKGFVVTGSSKLPLETSLAGVFAIGDVRAGSTKRVAAAVGEGAAAISQIHSYLAGLAAIAKDQLPPSSPD